MDTSTIPFDDFIYGCALRFDFDFYSKQLKKFNVPSRFYENKMTMWKYFKDFPDKCEIKLDKITNDIQKYQKELKRLSQRKLYPERFDAEYYVSLYPGNANAYEHWKNNGIFECKLFKLHENTIPPKKNKKPDVIPPQKEKPSKNLKKESDYQSELEKALTIETTEKEGKLPNDYEKAPTANVTKKEEISNNCEKDTKYINDTLNSYFLKKFGKQCDFVKQAYNMLLTNPDYFNKMANIKPKSKNKENVSKFSIQQKKDLLTDSLDETFFIMTQLLQSKN